MDASASIALGGTGASDLTAAAERQRDDHIHCSESAAKLIAAGLPQRAYVIFGFEEVRRSLAVDAHHALVVESGCYGLIAT